MADVGFPSSCFVCLVCLFVCLGSREGIKELTAWVGVCFACGIGGGMNWGGGGLNGKQEMRLPGTQRSAANEVCRCRAVLQQCYVTALSARDAGGLGLLLQGNANTTEEEEE